MYFFNDILYELTSILKQNHLRNMDNCCLLFGIYLFIHSIFYQKNLTIMITMNIGNACLFVLLLNSKAAKFIIYSEHISSTILEINPQCTYSSLRL